MVCLVLLMLTAGGPEWRHYEVYQPSIDRHFVVDPLSQSLKYNHVSSVARFKGHWVCVWNGNTAPEEGKPGQLNYMSTSPDGVHWAPPEPAFADGARCANPVPCPEGCQWQPNLMVVDGELWAFWDQYARDDTAGCYLSRLSEPGGKWRNHKLLWDGPVSATAGAAKPVIDGTPFRPFPTQNGVELGSGRILQPVTLMGPTADDAPDGIDGWWATEKRSSVLYSDDRGKTWHVSPGAIQPGRSWAQWEPTVWETPDGTVLMLARNNDIRAQSEGGPAPSSRLLWSFSKDGGETWSPHEAVSLETVVSRMHVVPTGGDRFVMVHNDWASGPFCRDRMNLALFFNRGGGIDFVAGTGFTGDEQFVAYPQAWIDNGSMTVSYTQGAGYRGIKVAHIDPLPDPDRYYLFPRANRPAAGGPTTSPEGLHFNGQQYLVTKQPVNPGEEAFSLGTWVQTSDIGVFVDSRGPSGGIVCGIATGANGQLVPFVHLGTPEGNIQPSIALPRREWAYCGLTVDNRAGTVLFVVDDKTETVPFTAPAKRPLPGITGHVGCKRFETSSLTGFVGTMGALALYGDVLMDAAAHAALRDKLRAASDGPPAQGDAQPILWLDGRKAVNPGVFSASETGAVVRHHAPQDGPGVLEIVGDASVGVDLDSNDRAVGDVVEFAFRARAVRGKDAVLCTVGDADRPVRVAVRGRMARIETPDRSVDLGLADDWLDVRVRTGQGFTRARVNDTAEHGIRHDPQATWLYLGDGYPISGAAVAGAVLVDVGSCRSRVMH